MFNRILATINVIKPGGKMSKKRTAIVNAGEELFSRFGARRVTVEEICRTAGASKMTFYKYFPNKSALVREIRDVWVEMGFRQFDEIDALDIPYMEKINLMTRWKVEFSARVNAEFLRELTSIDDVIAEIKRRFLNNIEKAQHRGDIRSDIVPELLWLIIEKIYESVKDESWKNVAADLSQFQEQVRTIIFFGLLNRAEEQRPESR